MKKQTYTLIMLILFGLSIGCSKLPEKSQKEQVSQTPTTVKETKPSVEDSMTLNEFKRAVRTADYDNYVDLGSDGNVQMPTSYSLLSSSLRHLGGGYYGAIILGTTNPLMSAHYIEFHPTHEYSVMKIYGGGAGRSTQFKNWGFEEIESGNQWISPDDTPYIKPLFEWLENKNNRP